MNALLMGIAAAMEEARKTMDTALLALQTSHAENDLLREQLASLRTENLALHRRIDEMAKKPLRVQA